MADKEKGEPEEEEATKISPLSTYLLPLYVEKWGLLLLSCSSLRV